MMTCSAFELDLASWYEIVGMKRSASDNSLSWREKKKLAPKRLQRSASSATVRAIVDFPMPASPFTQQIDSTLVSEIGRSNHCQILSRIAVRVPSKQRDGALDRFESYPASLARGILFNSSDTVFSYTDIRPRSDALIVDTHEVKNHLVNIRRHLVASIDNQD